MTDIKGRLTFAQLVILRRVAQKRAMSQKPAGFQDYKEYYTDYHDGYSVYSDAYFDSNAQWVDGKPVADTWDYGDSHSGWLSGGGCEFYNDVPKAPDHETGIIPAKSSFLQRIFGKHR